MQLVRRSDISPPPPAMFENCNFVGQIYQIFKKLVGQKFVLIIAIYNHRNYLTFLGKHAPIAPKVSHHRHSILMEIIINIPALLHYFVTTHFRRGE